MSVSINKALHGHLIDIYNLYTAVSKGNWNRHGGKLVYTESVSGLFRWRM